VLSFSSIPVKVSIIEYLDIAKRYSTSKSSVFINGVLDSVIKDMKKEGLFAKAGRGLME
jgi:N utilization substance protein B